MKITLHDGRTAEVAAGETVGSALTTLGIMSPAILAAKVNGRVLDLSSSMHEDATVEPLTFESFEGRDV